MNEFHFLRPAWFLALVPALLLLVLLWRRRGRSACWQDIVSPALLPYLLLETGQSVRRLPLVLLGLAWLLAVTALAGPTWERQPQPVYRAPADRVMVLDMSPSMAATDLKPDRLTRARFLIQNFLSNVQEGRTALMVFGAEPHVVAPLTDDVATIEALLPALSIDILPAPGNHVGPALRTAGRLLQRVGSARGEVLLLSDGIDDPADGLDAVNDLRSRGVQTSVVGVGTPKGAPVPTAEGGFEAASDGSVRLARLDESGLVALANAGGGRYLRLGEGHSVALAARAVDRDPTRGEADERSLESWVEKGPWLLLPLILIAASGFRRGWLGVLVVLVIPIPQAHAFSWQDLWLRPDQQASRLLDQGEAAAAAERFQDPRWRATAHYQAGDYAAAAEGFTGEDPDSVYNRGNALTRAGRLQEALAAYDQALQQQPEHEDARFNRELIEKLIRKQQQQSSQGNSSDSPQGEPQAGGDQTGSANDDDRPDPVASQEGQSETGDAANSAQSSQPQADAPDKGKVPSAGDEGSEQSAGGQTATEDRTGNPMAEKPDSTERARADLAPSANDAAAENADAEMRHEEPWADPGVASIADQPQHQMSEQELALEQWLRQVPDDPAGLLRRKFMLEHLLRQRGQQTP